MLCIFGRTKQTLRKNHGETVTGEEEKATVTDSWMAQNDHLPHWTSALGT